MDPKPSTCTFGGASRHMEKRLTTAIERAEPHEIPCQSNKTGGANTTELMRTLIAQQNHESLAKY
eukprot:scaffold16862_cov17-Prasinocladus_malaysianus.AAC.1